MPFRRRRRMRGRRRYGRRGRRGGRRSMGRRLLKIGYRM